jgi:PEP-CTERM motif
MRALVGYACALLIAGASYTNSHATLVHWTLSNVVFDDGGTASGYFIFDTDTKRVVITPREEDPVINDGFEIITTSGSRVPGFVVRPRDNIAHGNDVEIELSEQGIYAKDADYFWGRVVRFNIESGWLTSTNGTFAILPGTLGCDPATSVACSGESFVDDSLPPDYPLSHGTRSVLPGGMIEATVVPEPSAGMMLVVGLGMLGLTVLRHPARRRTGD